ncbi:MAG: hypothetical protein MZU95_12700 [Desulfomicrobium escambiense]|nr:hypothetical protein [Desulfomicrobium escambiense]
MCIDGPIIVRERYIYKVKVKKVSLKRALAGNSIAKVDSTLKNWCLEMKDVQTPTRSDLLNNRAKTLKLDVLNVIMDIIKVKIVMRGSKGYYTGTRSLAAKADS